jgi:hypothetical protein
VVLGGTDSFCWAGDQPGSLQYLQYLLLQTHFLIKDEDGKNGGVMLPHSFFFC